MRKSEGRNKEEEEEQEEEEEEDLTLDIFNFSDRFLLNLKIVKKNIKDKILLFMYAWHE